MKRSTNVVYLLILFTFLIGPTTQANGAQAGGDSKPLVEKTVHFNESDGIVAVEAEHFFKQELTDKRAFYHTNSKQNPVFEMDGDPAHIGGASNGAYLEILPDTRRNHSEKLIGGTNFSNEPGKLAVVSYKVNITNPGRYYVWVRAHSTGSEDNGIHVGLNGKWPASGQRMQWCVGKQQWFWESKQRTEKVHCGVPHKIFLDIEKPGVHTVHFSMREDGFEFDKWLMTTNKDFKRPADAGPVSTSNAASLPSFPLVKAPARPAVPKPVADPAHKKKQDQENAKQTAGKPAGALVIKAVDFPIDGTNYYVDQGKWLAVNPEKHKTGTATMPFPLPSGDYFVVLQTVGENDGSSTFDVSVGEKKFDTYTCPLANDTYQTGAKFHSKFGKTTIQKGAKIFVSSTIGSADGKEYSRARWEAIQFRPADPATQKAAAPFLAAQPKKAQPEKTDKRDRSTSPTQPVSELPLIQPRQPDGDGTVQISGELKQWHKISLTMKGPYAHEQDNQPNPFLDIRMQTTFTHSDGTSYDVPGYFAADGNAGESSAESGNLWRTNFAPEKTGQWKYVASIVSGDKAAIDPQAKTKPLFETSGTISVTDSDKSGRDLRAHGRLKYVGKHYLQHMGSGKYFLKAGADAPETLFGYADFDGTVAQKDNVPLKTFAAHQQDWADGDPVWKGSKGKGLIGAISYLSGKGCNAFSFLTYNAGGDGDNVWPFIERNDKLHYDCSKLDQWGIVLDHGTAKGMYLHFKMQETENDDHKKGGKKKNNGWVPTCLDGGNLGAQRRLYLRELIARFGHNLALNWNLGEENTQSTKQQIDMINYIRQTDPYDHHIVVHTYPGQQDSIYGSLLGDKSSLTGTSLQNSHLKDTHWQTVKWVRQSAKSGKPWVIAFDESGSAAHGQCPDIGYRGFDGKDTTGKYIYDQHSVRRQTLWGNIMGGGAGVEYYFGYKFAENDLLCEDWRSRDQSWDYCRICIEFFEKNKIPIQDMKPSDELVGNDGKGNSSYCFAKPNEIYLVYSSESKSFELDLSAATGEFSVDWYNPRTGGEIIQGETTINSGGKVKIEPDDDNENHDWLAVIRRK